MRIVISVVIVAAIALVVGFATSPEPESSTPPTSTLEPVSFTLSIGVSPSEAGSVSPASGQYEEGTHVTLTAAPASGYTFDYWGGDTSGSLATITITIDSDKSITAYFSVVDTTPPIISGVEVSDITETSAIITWTTDGPATSQVEYGQTLPYDSITALNEDLVIDHRVNLDLAPPLASWHFRVISVDKAGNKAMSAGFFFRTGLPAYLPIQ